MHGIIPVMLSFFAIFQPGAAQAFFTAARAVAHIEWQVGYWQTDQMYAQLQEATGFKTVISEQITNGAFVDALAGWTTSGSVQTTQSDCGEVPEQSVSLGSKVDTEQTMREANFISQSFDRGHARSLLIEYCLASWETAPLFDEPALQVFVNNTLVWEDAVAIQSSPADPKVPTTTNWRSALVALPQTDVLELRINAGNTIDAERPTVAYIKRVSTAVWNVQAGSVVSITPVVGDVQVFLNDQVIVANKNNSTLNISADQISQFGSAILRIRVSDTIVQEISTFSLRSPVVIPAIWYELRTNSTDLAGYFSAPADGMGEKLVRYEVWQQVGAVEQQVQHTGSFLWSTPRMPGSQEYLTFPYATNAAYQVRFIDRGGTVTASNWQAVVTE